MTDLGTASRAFGINDRGDVIGLSCLSDTPCPFFSVHHAVIWR